MKRSAIETHSLAALALGLLLVLGLAGCGDDGNNTCTPSCAGAACGDVDGCGGMCDGTCPDDQTCSGAFVCVDDCTPDCTGAACGDDDGCGDMCDGTCPAGEVCNASFECEVECTPDCAGKNCGDDDGCGGTCDTCGAGEICLNATCMAETDDSDWDPDANEQGEAGENCPVALNNNICTVPGGKANAITADQHWTADITYVLDGTVFIGDDPAQDDPAQVTPATLTIDPGTVIYGDPNAASTAALVIQRGSKIYALGASDNPIVFTSAKNVGERGPGDWGGVVINGLSPSNGCAQAPCYLEGEGQTGYYGGSDPADDSGVFKYVRIEFSGRRLTDTKEFNGMALQGVGTGTSIHHVQIHRASDDTIEFFGGTAQVHHLLLSGCEDDLFDWTNGWAGKAQFVIGHQLTDVAGERGIEADNLEDDHDAMPRSMPTLYNFTFIGDPDSPIGADGLKLRRGTGATIRNFLVYGFASSCLDISDDATWDQVTAGDLSVANSSMGPNGCPDGAENVALFEGEATNAYTDALMLTDVNDTAPDYTPATGSPAFNAAAAAPAGDGFFRTVDFQGGLSPRPNSNWLAGWTAFPQD